MKPVAAGSRLTISTAGGGGYGLAAERDVERVLMDVRRGLVSVERAAKAYGVVVAELTDGWGIDEVATAHLRQELLKVEAGSEP